MCNPYDYKGLHGSGRPGDSERSLFSFFGLDKFANVYYCIIKVIHQGDDMNRMKDRLNQVRRNRMRQKLEVAAITVTLILLPLHAALAAYEVQGCGSGPEGVRTVEALRPTEHGLVLALAVGAEQVAEVRVQTPFVSGTGPQLVKDIVRKAGSILGDWIDGNGSSDPRLKGSQDADSRRSP
jgi:hypothetical protein